MISVPVTCDVIARISWKGYSVIQKINLNEYKNILTKLPKGTRIDVLSYQANNVYGWSMLYDVIIDKETPYSMNWITTNFPGITFYKPIRSKFRFVPLLPERFTRPIRLGDYLLGVFALAKVKKIRIEQKGKIYNDLGSYLRKHNPLIDTKVFINDKEFDWKTYLDKDNIIHYLREFYTNKMDVYLTHIMIHSGFLAPVVFSGVDLSEFVIDGKLRVPIDNYWIFYLMYGRQYEVISDLGRDGIFSLNTIIEKKENFRYSREPRAILKIESKLNRPVVINGLFPMRFK